MILLPAIIGLTIAPLAQPPNLVRNGSFDRDAAGWSAWYEPAAADGELRWQSVDGNGVAHIIVRRRLKPTAVQIYQGPFALRSSATYLISFRARAEAKTSLRVVVISHSPPWRNFGFSSKVQVDSAWRNYAFLFQPTADTKNARIDFMPAGTIWLDDVSIRPYSGTLQRADLRRVILGPDWSGDPARLTDAKLSPAISSRGHAEMPLIFAAELSRPQPVARVVVRCVIPYRHAAASRIAADISADGRTWYAWGEASAIPDRTPGFPKQQTFSVTGMLAAAKFVRIRVERALNRAIVAELEVYAAPDVRPGDPAGLPQRPPAQDLALAGLDYDAAGYVLSPGEPAEIRFKNRWLSEVQAQADWALEDYSGRKLASGSGRIAVAPAAIAKLRIKLPSSLKSGWYRARVKFEGAEALLGFCFIRPRTGPLSLKVAALMDCIDPEGWLRIMAGPLADYWNITRSCRGADVAVVAAEADKPQPWADELRSYLAQGGAAIFYGKLPAWLEELAPVRMNRSSPFASSPARLASVPLWPGFRPELCPPHYHTAVEPKPGARVLARWADGQPAIVQAGRRMYVATVPGKLWQKSYGHLPPWDELLVRAAYALAGRPAATQALAAEVRRAEEAASRAEEQALRQASLRAADGWRIGASLGNFGRNGWIAPEQGLEMQIDSTGRISQFGARVQFRLSFDGKQPASVTTLRAGWLSKTLSLEGTGARCTISAAAPWLMIEGTAKRVRFAGLSGTLVVPAAAGPRALSEAAKLDGRSLRTGWLVIIPDADRAAPTAIFLTRRPGSISLQPSGLELAFPSGFGALFIGRLWGIRQLSIDPRKPAGLQRIARQAQRLEPICLAFPVDCTEAFRVLPDGVEIVDAFKFREHRSEFGTKPRRLAPIPPPLALAVTRGRYPARIAGKPLDLEVATLCGPYMAVAGPRLRYALPRAPEDHYGLIAITGAMDLQADMERYARQGIAAVRHASGGYTTPSSFIADMAAYERGGLLPPFQAPCIDLYKWWFCFPTLLARPVYSDEMRRQADSTWRERYWRTLNFYLPKTLIRYRREPFTGLGYGLTFVWPVHMRDGVRMFIDENEGACVVLYCMWAYCQYYGDWATAASCWPAVWLYHSYLRRVHDWAFMASSNAEFYSTVGIDMLNSEMPGNLAFARMARQVGDTRAEHLGLYLAAKASVPTIARAFMPAYLESITPPDHPWRRYRFIWSFHAAGWSGGERADEGDWEKTLFRAIRFLDTSKGTGPEICLLHRLYAADHMNRWQHAIDEAAARRKAAPGWGHLMMRAFLGWPREKVLAAARRFHEIKKNYGWLSAKGPSNIAAVCTAYTPIFISDWAPAGYISGTFNPATHAAALRFKSSRPFTIRLYSRWRPLQIAIDGKRLSAKSWSYDASSGWLTIHAPAGSSNITIRFSDKPSAPPHPYTPGPSQRL